jgi:hypothetical protein
MNHKVIPIFPLAGQSSPIETILKTILPKAGIDMSRAIVPPTPVSLDGEASPSDEVVLKRFVDHFNRVKIHLTVPVIVVIPFRRGAAEFLKTVEAVRQRIDYALINHLTRNIVLLEDGQAAATFRNESRRIGELEGDVYKGARLHTKRLGKFFVLPHLLSITDLDMWNLLSAFTHREADHLSDVDRNERPSLVFPTPPGAYPAPRGGAGPSARKPTSLSDKVSTILGGVLPTKRRS